MAQGGALLRPREATLNWALVGAAVWIGLGLWVHDLTYLFPAGMCAALALQCRQRIEVDGRYAQRFGLRPARVDLATAQVVCGGVGWWRELFFCGRSLQLRDADGQVLYLESWLWDAATRSQLVEGIARDGRS